MLVMRDARCGELNDIGAALAVVLFQQPEYFVISKLAGAHDLRYMLLFLPLQPFVFYCGMHFDGAVIYDHALRLLIAPSILAVSSKSTIHAAPNATHDHI